MIGVGDVGNGGLSVVTVVTTIFYSYKRRPTRRHNPHPIGLTRIASLDEVRGSCSNIISPSRFDSLTFGVSNPLMTVGMLRKRQIGGKRMITRVSPASCGLSCSTGETSFRGTSSRVRHTRGLLTGGTVSVRRFRAARTSCAGTGSTFRGTRGALGSAGLHTPFSNFVRGGCIRGCRHMRPKRKIIYLVGPTGLRIRFAVPRAGVSCMASPSAVCMRFSTCGKGLFRTGMGRCMRTSPSKTKIPMFLCVSSPRFSLGGCGMSINFSYHIVIGVRGSIMGRKVAIPLSTMIFSGGLGDGVMFVCGPSARGMRLHGIDSRKVVMKHGSLVMSKGVRPNRRIISTKTSCLMSNRRMGVLARWGEERRVVGVPGCSLRGQGIVCFFLTVLLVNKMVSFFGLPGGRSTPFIVGATMLIARCPKTGPRRIRGLVARPVRHRVRSVASMCRVGSRSCFKLSGVSVRLRPAVSPSCVPMG